MLYISILPLEKFRDLMTTGELYFCRADLFTNDVREGLPPEEYLPAFGLHPLDVLDRQQLCHHIGSDAQFRKKPMHLALYDIVDRQCFREFDLEHYAMNLVFSLLPTAPAVSRRTHNNFQSAVVSVAE